MLRNAEGMGAGQISLKKRINFKDVWFNVISVTRGWVGVEFAEKSAKLTNCDAKISPVADGVNLTRDFHGDQRDVGFRQRQRAGTAKYFVGALNAGRDARLRADDSRYRRRPLECRLRFRVDGTRQCRTAVMAHENGFITGMLLPV